MNEDYNVYWPNINDNLNNKDYENEDYNVYWPNINDNLNNKDYEYDKLYKLSMLEFKIRKIEKLLSKIEHFLNKFFDTDINKEDE